MNLKYKQIKDLFTSQIKTIVGGLWFSGIRGEGEYKQWNQSGNLIKSKVF